MTLQEMILAAIREDMPAGDITTDSLALAPRFGQAKLIAREDLVLSGTDPFEQTILTLEPLAKLVWHFREGQMALARQTVCDITGDLVQILKAERVALNFICHLSGIASLTRCYAKEVEKTKTTILDTRKTLPMYRELEKRAVRHGGGQSHRKSLSAAILVKDNHISLAGGITNAVRRIREHSQEPIEVECENLAQVKEAIGLKIDRILLDNMSNEQMTEALALIPKSIETEASGNMSLSRIRSVSQLGVNYISVGALTHSAPTADLSLEFEWQSESTPLKGSR